MRKLNILFATLLLQYTTLILDFSAGTMDERGCAEKADRCDTLDDRYNAGRVENPTPGMSSTIHVNRVSFSKFACYFRIKIETEFSDAGVVGMIAVPHDIRN